MIQNELQKKILSGAACLLAVAMLFPPFVFELFGQSGVGPKSSAGYAFLFDPPLKGDYLQARVDVAVLLVELLVICLISFVAVVCAITLPRNLE
jgi:hypothetical protein